MFEDELIFLASPLHPWAQQHPKTKDLAGETYIISSRNSSTFEMIGEYFLKLGVRPKSFIELGNTAAITSAVSDPNAANNTATDTDTVTPSDPEIFDDGFES